jgi:hypothetical protein
MLKEGEPYTPKASKVTYIISPFWRCTASNRKRFTLLPSLMTYGFQLGPRESTEQISSVSPTRVPMIQYFPPSKIRTTVTKPPSSICRGLITSVPPINDHSVFSLTEETLKRVVYDAGTRLCASSCEAMHSHFDGVTRFLNPAGREMAFSGGHPSVGKVVVISKRSRRVP